jgi:hypothetical protein
MFYLSPLNFVNQSANEMSLLIFVFAGTLLDYFSIRFSFSCATGLRSFKRAAFTPTLTKYDVAGLPT